jgi:hypothetical protein
MKHIKSNSVKEIQHPELNVKKIFVFFILLYPMIICSQTCDSIVPFFTVDLSSKPDSIWVSPSTPRDGYCCGAVYPEKCIEFKITISPAAIGVIIHIYSSFVGPFYVNFDCNNLTSVEDTVFFPTVGPHSLTLCKPGNTIYTYAIESVPDSTTTISNIEQQDKIIIYPNPTNDYIIIESKSFQNKSYKLMDISGRIIKSGIFKEQQEIKLESFAAGFYFIELIFDRQLIRQKIIKK